MSGQRSGEKPAGGHNVAARRDVHVDDLAVLVHGPVDVPPSAGHLHLGFVDEPPAAHRVPACPGRVEQKGREVLDPPVQGHAIHLYPPFGQDLLEVAVRQSERRYQRTASKITSGGNR
jgi:hypothetical protein